jgi:hypothetical protein
MQSKHGITREALEKAVVDHFFAPLSTPISLAGWK